ncbi:MBL fold metallo-hydrolase [Thiovibrio sp. JS02]
MKIHFLGVGEACDPVCFNTSLLVAARSGANTHYILLDCGFTTPHRYFLDYPLADQLDALWISHFHGDHFFGLPLLLLRFWEMGRTKPLLMVGPAGLREKVELALDLAYPAFGSRLQFPLQYLTAAPDLPSFPAAGCSWRFARVEHPQSALALRLSAGGKSLYYSGDGRPTPESLKLATGCDLVVQEAYRAEEETPNHGSVGASVRFAGRAGAKMLALVHVAHHERARAKAGMAELSAHDPALTILLPEPGARLEL